jgi:tripartite-type tricarboxylate transporter receptor subunit TctC
MRLILTAIVASCLASAASPAAAQDTPADFFKERQLRIVVGSAAGSGFDLNARMLARHWPNHVPGRPTFVVQNQPGGGSITMANSLIASAPRDGSVIGAAINGMPTAPLLQPETARYDSTKVNWIGSTNRDTVVAFVWHTSKVKSIADLAHAEISVGATSAGTAQYDFPVVARAITGLSLKVVAGYKGTTDILIALERGEVEGVGALAMQSLRALHPGWIADGKVRLIMQHGLERHPSLPDVPTLLSLAQRNDDAQALRLLVARLEYGRPFFLPPDVPADRVAALRRAFDATMKDPAYQADMTNAGLEVSPMS